MKEHCFKHIVSMFALFIQASTDYKTELHSPKYPEVDSSSMLISWYASNA